MLPVMLSYLQIMYIEFVALGIEDLNISSLGYYLWKTFEVFHLIASQNSFRYYLWKI